MLYKKISVQLDNMGSQALDDILTVNKCTISDAVNAALLAYSKDKQPSMIIEPKPMDAVRSAIEAKFTTVENYCLIKGISKARLVYLVNRCAKGSTVWGLGNTKNKWRDKQDGRQFKTHTAWIAHCLNEDFGIDLT